MQVTAVSEASGRVIVALRAAGRSRATVKRHEAQFNAFAGFLEARGRAVPTEVDCLDFIAERSGSRLAGLREPTSCGRAQLARRPLLLLMEALAGGVPLVGQATTPPVERCPARFRGGQGPVPRGVPAAGERGSHRRDEAACCGPVPRLPGGGRSGNPRAGAGPGLGRVLGSASAAGVRPEDDRVAAFGVG